MYNFINNEDIMITVVYSNYDIEMKSTCTWSWLVKLVQAGSVVSSVQEFGREELNEEQLLVLMDRITECDPPELSMNGIPF